MPKPADVDQTLWNAAAEKALALGFTFESNCEALVRNQLQQAAPKVKDPNQLPLAIEAVERLITEMVSQAQSMGFQTLHEPTFFAALQKLCPIWPIC